MHLDRRSVRGVGLPFATNAFAATPARAVRPPGLRLMPFEEAVRTAFRAASADPVRRVAVGWSELVQSGLQGCVIRRTFAGFPRIRPSGTPGTSRRVWFDTLTTRGSPSTTGLPSGPSVRWQSAGPTGFTWAAMAG